jgi:aminoglycoside phosphotransferase (APT) family kinase protein
LKRVAAEAIGQKADDVDSLRKFAEGGFNRTFEITINDGTQLIARVPYVSTVPRTLAIASEVATHGLVRSYGISVPKVYAYWTDPKNDVGTEYIIMERLDSKVLRDLFYAIPEKDCIQMMLQVTEIEGALF